MSKSLIELPPLPQATRVQLSAEALAMKAQALEVAALVGRVNSEEENQTAVIAQSQLQQVSRLLEKARVEATKPFLEAQRELKQAVDKEKAELDAEAFRVSKLIGDYQALLLMQRRAAEAAAAEAASKLERERMAELAKAKSHEQAEAIQAHFNDRAAIEAPPPTPEPVRAKGQVVTTDWEITRLNELQLARARPDLIRKIEFDTRAIKAELAAGRKLPGVEAREVVNSTTRGRALTVDV